MTETHLRAGHDAIIPQLNDGTGMVESLARPATTTGAQLDEILLLSADDPLRRVEARRAELEATGTAHPLRIASIDRASLTSIIAELQAVAEARPQTVVIYTAAGAIYDAYRSLRKALE